MIDAQPTTRHCPWCDAAAPEEATTCPACGAALAGREDLAGPVIPGVTTVDPVLGAFDARPRHLSGNSPSQSVASAVIPAAVLGGPIGAVSLGGTSGGVRRTGRGRGGRTARAGSMSHD